MNPTSCFPNPTDCFTTGLGAVPQTNTDLEKSGYPYTMNNCLTNENRRPLSHMQYMWDVYDWHNDADGDTVQQGLDCFWCMFTNLNAYPAGAGSLQVNEPWNAALTAYDPAQPDGRGSSSYSSNYYSAFSVPTSILRTDNCIPP